MRELDLRLYFVIDVKEGHGDPLAVTEAAVQGGATLVQLRAKSGSDSEWIALAADLQKMLQRYQVPLIINDRVALAKAVNAAGVHLGKQDTDLKVARAQLGADAIIGYSIEALSDLHAVANADVDYVAVSPVFATTTKADIMLPLGVTGVEQVVAKTVLPVVGIGGIGMENSAAVIAAGASGVAVVSAIASARDPAAAAAELRRVVDRALHTRFAPAQHRRVLTIAGSDSGGGAGIQADIKTFQALGCYGMSAITAVTAQNTRVVTKIEALTPAMVEAQLDAVYSDIGVDAVKIGMLHSAPIIRTVARTLHRHSAKNIVLDPVMIAKSGDALINDAAIATLRDELLPLTALITPNIPEGERLTGRGINSREDMLVAAGSLSQYVPHVLIKGGHADFSVDCVDGYFADESMQWLQQPRLRTKNTHGTGCTYAAAITAYRALGLPWTQCVRLANRYLHNAILSGSGRELGSGSGPVDHAWRQRRDQCAF